jgi:tetratricopeptide (TPR) repeat protein
MGRFDDAISQINYAGELDPINVSNRVQLGMVAMETRNYDLAIEEFRQAGDDTHLGFAYAYKKMYPEAIAAYQRAAKRQGRQPVIIAQLAWTYGLAGRKQEAQNFIVELGKIAGRRYVSPTLFANAYLGVGDKDQALRWLERGYVEHDQWMAYLKIARIVDPLRPEPRFQAVLQRMNFPE